MIDIILFFIGAGALRFHLPLGVALIFAAFNYPGWVIESGNVPAAVFAIILGAADLVLKLFSIEPDFLDSILKFYYATPLPRSQVRMMLSSAELPTREQVIAMVLARIAVLSLLSITIYFTGVGTPIGLKDVTPTPEKSLSLAEEMAQFVVRGIGYSVAFAGSFFHIIGTLAAVAYTIYLGMRYGRVFISYRFFFSHTKVIWKTSRAPPAPRVEATPGPMQLSAPMQPSVPAQPHQVTGYEPHITKSYDAIVDGSNIAHMGQEPPTLIRLALVVRKLTELGIGWIVIVDASLKHRLPSSGIRPDLAEVLTGVQKPMAEREALTEAIKAQKVIEVPAGTDADRFILGFARRWNSIVVSNDTFSDLKGEFPDAQRRRVTCVVIGEEVVFEPDPIQTLRSLREGPEDTRPSYIS